jgi:rRNA maturation endonuclease Nob1
MLPIPPSQPGQNGWSSLDFPLFTSAPRAFSPKKNNHKTVRAASSWLSHEMPQELIMMTAPHVPTSPKKKHPPKVRHKHLRATAPNSSSTMDSHFGKNNMKSIQANETVVIINPSKLKEHHHNHLIACQTVPTSPRFSQDSYDFHAIVNNGNNNNNNNNNNLTASTFAAREQFNTIKHIHAKREAVALTETKIYQTLKNNKIRSKPPVFDLTSHKHIGAEDKFQYLRHSPRSLDMKIHNANHFSMVQEQVDPNANLIHPHHKHLGKKDGDSKNHDIKYLHRALERQDDRRNTATWQKDYTHVSNVPSWAHMEWRHQPIGGNTEYIGHQVCPDCKTVTRKSTTLVCRSCGAFDPALELPNSSSSQCSPRNVRGLDMTQLPMHGTLKGGGLGREEHRYAVGMTKQQHEQVWRTNKNLIVSMHKWKIAKNKVERRRQKEHFRSFRNEPNSKDIGRQHSPRYRNGISHADQGYEMLARRASGDPRVELSMRMESTCPVGTKVFGVQGPLPKR